MTKKKQGRDLQEEAVKAKDYVLCDLLREELRKVILKDAKPWFSSTEKMLD